MRRSSPQDKVDPAEALMREVGAQLRQVRLERGEDLETAAQYLRIKPAYLAGIEEGDLSTLPGRTYALGFLRSYADHLGFDGQDLVTQIKSAVGNLTKKQRLRIHAPMPESRLPKAPVLAISLMLILAVYGAWSYVGGSGEQAVETVSEVPEDLRKVAIDALAPAPERVAPDEPQSRAGQPTAPSAVASSAVESRETPADPAAPSEQNGLQQAVPAQAPDAATPAPESNSPTDPGRTHATETSAVASATQGLVERQEDAFEPGAGPPGVASAEAGAASGSAVDGGGPDAHGQTALVPGETAGAASPSATPAGAPPSAQQVLAALQESAGSGAGGVVRVYAADNADARVILRALGTSWVHVSSATGDYLHVRTLEPGDALLVPNRPDLSLWTGNAGGLEIFVDGRALPPLGSDGRVMRDIALDPKSLLARTRSRAE